MKKLLIILLLIVGCEGVYTPEDCAGIAGGDAVEDVCGVCEGDGVCLPEHCTDDNKSGYCQDLNVLQILIDNSLVTLNMDMDENSNGVIEPLELGVQEWLDGRLVYLQCVNIGLSGKIPSEIGNLTNLEHLYLDINQLTGEIPQEVCELIESNNLDMDWIITGNNLTNTCE